MLVEGEVSVESIIFHSSSLLAKIEKYLEENELWNLAQVNRATHQSVMNYFSKNYRPLFSNILQYRSLYPENFPSNTDPSAYLSLLNENNTICAYTAILSLVATKLKIEITIDDKLFDTMITDNSYNKDDKNYILESLMPFFNDQQCIKLLHVLNEKINDYYDRTKAKKINKLLIGIIKRLSDIDADNFLAEKICRLYVNRKCFNPDDKKKVIEEVIKRRNSTAILQRNDAMLNGSELPFCATSIKEAASRLSINDFDALSLYSALNELSQNSFRAQWEFAALTVRYFTDKEQANLIELLKKFFLQIKKIGYEIKENNFLGVNAFHALIKLLKLENNRKFIDEEMILVIHDALFFYSKIPADYEAEYNYILRDFKVSNFELMDIFSIVNVDLTYFNDNVQVIYNILRYFEDLCDFKIFNDDIYRNKFKKILSSWLDLSESEFRKKFYYFNHKFDIFLNNKNDSTSTKIDYLFDKVILLCRENLLSDDFDNVVFFLIKYKEFFYDVNNLILRLFDGVSMKGLDALKCYVIESLGMNSVRSWSVSTENLLRKILKHSSLKRSSTDNLSKEVVLLAESDIYIFLIL